MGLAGKGALDAERGAGERALGFASSAAYLVALRDRTLLRTCCGLLSLKTVQGCSADPSLSSLLALPAAKGLS